MDLIFDVTGLNSEEEKFSDSKKDVLKFLKIIGVDTRFISYTPEKIYINNLRFSKFSRTREATFNKQYPEIEVVRSSLFQKICSRSAKVLTLEIKPNSTILMPEVNLVNDGDYDLKVNPLILDDKVNTIFEGIFAGEGLNLINSEKEIYPLANVSLDWINSFLEVDGQDLIGYENKDDLANSFSEFLDDVAPQFRENVVSASEFIDSKLKNKN